MVLLYGLFRTTLDEVDVESRFGGVTEVLYLEIFRSIDLSFSRPPQVSSVTRHPPDWAAETGGARVVEVHVEFPHCSPEHMVPKHHAECLLVIGLDTSIYRGYKAGFVELCCICGFDIDVIAC